MTLQIYTDLQILGGQTQFDIVRMSNSSGRLPIELQTVSGRIGIVPVELSSVLQYSWVELPRMTFELSRCMGSSCRRIQRTLTN